MYRSVDFLKHEKHLFYPLVSIRTSYYINSAWQKKGVIGSSYLAM